MMKKGMITSLNSVIKSHLILFELGEYLVRFMRLLPGLLGVGWPYVFYSTNSTPHGSDLM
jgi:hypothetical protein